MLQNVDHVFFYSRYLDRSHWKRTGFKPGTGNLQPKPRNVVTAWCMIFFAPSSHTTSQQHTNKQWLAMAATWVQTPCPSTTAATLHTWVRWLLSSLQAWVTPTTTIQGPCPVPLQHFRSDLLPHTWQTCQVH